MEKQQGEREGERERESWADRILELRGKKGFGPSFVVSGGKRRVGCVVCTGGKMRRLESFRDFLYSSSCEIALCAKKYSLQFLDVPGHAGRAEKNRLKHLNVGKQFAFFPRYLISHSDHLSLSPASEIREK